ncbi:MAG: cyclic nucleotide-binding domain-containing protein [Proteobacteria bacterium]|nr:cyclic nucleotide-binding domain-containing protein [Pseudomonadota bacterium]
MKKTKQTFNDGDVIFREGGPSDAAYEIVSGTVEIAKMGNDGNVLLATLGAGEMFGEMGVLDQGERNATAKAIGPVTVNAIDRKDFLAAVEGNPDTALDVIGNLADKLRGADDKLVHGAGTPTGDDAKPQYLMPQESAGAAPAPALTAGAGFWTRLLGLAALSETERIKVRVAPFSGEGGGEHAKHVVRALERRKGIRVKGLKKPLKVQPGDPAKAVLAAARRVLADSESDMLIWGDVPPPELTLHLKFISFATWDEDPPGSFVLGTVLPLPVDFADPFADFLYAVSLAATVPKSEAKAAALARELPLALDGAGAVLDDGTGDMTRRERGLVRTCYANALTTVAIQRGEVSLYRRAVETYKECLSVLTEEETPLEWALIQKNLGSVLQSIAERSGDNEVLGEAADAFRAALKVLTRNDDPMDWAAVQNRLGEALFRLDFESGDIDMLKHALGAYQSAMRVYTRADTPMRWAEVMNNFAQVTQVLGEELKNAEAIEKAANACRSALEVRTKAKNPVLWAATQNNLGSALFLLGKMTKNADRLRGAAEAFDLASGVYRARGMNKMAAITEKNLGRVTQLLDQTQPKGVPRMRWESDGPGDDN